MTIPMKELKARAQRLDPVVHVGKAGVDDRLLAALDEALNQHGLVKVKLKAFKEEKKAVFAQLAECSGSQVVLAVGHTITLWRERS